MKYTCDVLPSNVDKKSYEGEAPVRLCNYTDVYYNEAITPGMSFMEASASPEQIAKFSLRAGDTVITKDSETADDIAIAAHVPLDLPGVVCGYHLAIVRPTTSIDGRFVKRLFDSHYLRSRFETLANGLTRVGLSQDALANVVIPRPPADEQAAIATFLTRETAKIDALIAEQEKLIALLAEKRQATISHAVTRGLDPDVPMKDSGVPWLGEVPARWRVVPLMHLTEASRPIMYGIVLPGPDVEDGIPILKGGDVKPHRLKLELLNRTTPEIEAPYARARLRPRDIVYSIRGTIGEAELVPNELEGANITQDVARVAPALGVSAEWLLQALKSDPVFVQLEQRSLGAAVRGINIFELKRARIPVPPPSEQERIAAFLEAESRKLDNLQRDAERSITLLRERRSALITAAVTGQIDVRGLVADTASRPIEREPTSA
ncbi:MAG: restriction endonuclease subunit S [Rubrivivax sp.]|nr:restriction endonuclease subunit S [Rubrivivax sp.]